MSFDPESITPSKLNDLRGAAEAAWGDDTRHENFIHDPQPSAGQCFVTSAWMKDKLGGHVGEKNGHHFWVSPDKSHIVDLTGDLFPSEPLDDHEIGQPVDDEDEPWEAHPNQLRHQPGPVMYKRATHPIWKGFRVLPDDVDKDHERAKLFKKRADAALNGHRVADLMGADPYPASTPQYQEDYKNESTFHDTPEDQSDSDLDSNEYNFVVANGQVHLSPFNEHAGLAAIAGHDLSSDGPFAAGTATVHGGQVQWSVSSNIGLRGLADILRSYSERTGWGFGGLEDSEGSKFAAFGPDRTFYSKTRADGHLILSERPLPNAERIKVRGDVAHVAKRTEALEEWAKDYGFKLAEYPGGGNMLDQMKNREHLELHNNGDPNWQPESDNEDLTLHNVKCGECGKKFNDEQELVEHRRNTHEMWEEPVEDGHFPQVQDFDIPLGFGTHGVPNGGETIAKVTDIVVQGISFTESLRYPGRREAAWRDDTVRHFGAYKDGQLIAYATMDGNALVELRCKGPREAAQSLLGLIKRHYPVLTAYSPTKYVASLLWHEGMPCVTAGKRFVYAAGKDPKDMIQAEVPFVFDVNKGRISIGYAGESTADVQPSGYKKFSPGGIMEGYYGPGGKVTFTSATGVPWTVRNFAQLWYNQFPQMEITSVDQQDAATGKSQKLAAEGQDVGNYLRTLVASDRAAFTATEALKQAGGKVYVVGGAVRDALRGNEPRDLDLMVSGVPAESVAHALGALPGRVDLTGKNFGVYRYKVGGQEVEIALPREDKYDEGSRAKGQITTDHNLPVEDDLKRRDFTVNSMAVDLDNGKLIDPYGGKDDIENHVLRTTHSDSFREDPTRLVRALTAHSRFGLHPDERTRSEMESNGHMLRHESPDAIRGTLDKLFSSGNPAAALRLGNETGVLKHIFPEVADNFAFDQNNQHHQKQLGEHLLSVLDHTSKQSSDPDLRMAAFLHDIGKPASEWTDPATGQSHYYEGPNGEGADHETVGAHMAESRLRELHYPNARINRVRNLIQHHMYPAFQTPKGARKFLNRVGDHADDLMTLRQADMMGKGTKEDEMSVATQNGQRQLVDEARKQQAPTDLQNLNINGNDLQSLGVKPGPAIGNILRELLNDVVNDPHLNTHDALMQRAQTYINAL